MKKTIFALAITLVSFAGFAQTKPSAKSTKPASHVAKADTVKKAPASKKVASEKKVH